MSEETKKYTNGQITIVWKPEACIHSRLCWTQLGEVFNPRIRPWINMEAADTDRIIDQINKCPSGALSFYKNEAPNPPAEITTETKVEAIPNGPLLVYGNISVKLKDGAEQKRAKSPLSAVVENPRTNLFATAAILVQDLKVKTAGIRVASCPNSRPFC